MEIGTFPGGYRSQRTRPRLPEQTTGRRHYVYRRETDFGRGARSRSGPETRSNPRLSNTNGGASPPALSKHCMRSGSVRSDHSQRRKAETIPPVPTLSLPPPLTDLFFLGAKTRQLRLSSKTPFFLPPSVLRFSRCLRAFLFCFRVAQFSLPNYSELYSYGSRIIASSLHLTEPAASGTLTQREPESLCRRTIVERRPPTAPPMRKEVEHSSEQKKKKRQKRNYCFQGRM